MKFIEKLVLEIIRYTLKTHKNLAPRIEAMAVHAQNHSLHDSKFLLAINGELLAKSKSQLRQDLFVLSELNFKRGGFFVEFGATNGVDLSNSHLLEKEYSWKGILAEPAKLWHEDLRKNRNAKIDTRCVWKKTGELLKFSETSAPELSTLSSFSDSDLHARERAGAISYEVETISLNDLLAENDAPSEIDYLSIDTEGSEFEILQSLDFDKYKFKVITCEHNYSPAREKIFELLTANGYIKKYEEISEFDDWYVRSESQ